MQRPTAKVGSFPWSSRTPTHLQTYIPQPCWRKRREIVGARGIEDTRWAWVWNQLSRTHESSQRIKGQTWSLKGPMQGPLYMCYGCWLDVSVGNLTVGVSLILLPTLGLFFFQWAVSSSIDVRICTWSYCILLWHAWLMFLGDLSFWWGRQVGVDLGQRADGGRDERN